MYISIKIFHFVIPKYNNSDKQNTKKLDKLRVISFFEECFGQ